MRYLIYIVSCIVVIISAAYTYEYAGFYDEDIKKCNAELLYKTDKLQSNSQILYFGESSDFTSPDQDTCRLAISELVARLYPGQKVSGISKSATHAATFKTLIKRIGEGSPVHTVIVTMSLRSFGINWIQSELETNLSRANVLYSNYNPLLKKCMLSFKAYDDMPVFKRKEIIKYHYKHDKFELSKLKFKSVYEWDKYVFDKGVLDVNGNKDIEETAIACHFIKNYAFVISEDNPRIRDFDDIVNICKEKKLKLVFHILPENCERAAKLCGNDLTELMTKNVELLKNRYGKQAILINNYNLLPDSIFIDRQWPTEHYTFAGRYLVAKRISEKLN